jgi:hypothetical protein
MRLAPSAHKAMTDIILSLLINDPAGLAEIPSISHDCFSVTKRHPV